MKSKHSKSGTNDHVQKEFVCGGWIPKATFGESERSRGDHGGRGAMGITQGGIALAGGTGGRVLLVAGGGKTLAGATGERALLAAKEVASQSGAWQGGRQGSRTLGQDSRWVPVGGGGIEVGARVGGGCETIEDGTCWGSSR